MSSPGSDRGLRSLHVALLIVLAQGAGTVYAAIPDVNRLDPLILGRNR